MLKQLLAVMAVLTAPIFASAQETGALPQEEVFAYFEQLVQWQRDAAVIDPATSSPRELIFSDTLEQNALKALRSGFKYAQQQAKVAVPAAAEPAAQGEEITPQQRITQRLSEIEQRMAQLRAQLRAGGLSAKDRKALEDRLQLASAKQDLFQTVLGNIASVSSGSAKDMAGKIGNLAREIPEITGGEHKPAGQAAVAGAEPSTRTVTSVLTIAGDLFHITRKQRALQEYANHSNQLVQTTRAQLQKLRALLDAVDSNQAGVAVEAQLASFKHIGNSILPLGDALLWTRANEQILADWRMLLDERFDVLMRRLLVQFALLGITLAIPLVIGEAARRAIGRYVTDPRRKRQANTARRIVVSVVILFIVLFNFISDFSSFATFAGFMTAGLAVALQSVLLSLVAHFFFYGRYGVRPGDRVNVAGVTGDIIQIGIIRFYLRELRTEEGELKPTGKIVAFPNSILFQPTAFYKYVQDTVN